MLPSQAGGTNWPGGSFDPETGIIYLYTYTQVVSLGLINDPERSDMNFIRGRAPEVNARDAALTNARQGNFEAQFFHAVFCEKMGEMRGSAMFCGSRGRYAII